MRRVTVVEEGSKLPSIKITWSGDPMEHPDIEFSGQWDHRQIRSLPHEINLAFRKHLVKLQSEGVGRNQDQIQEEEGE